MAAVGEHDRLKSHGVKNIVETAAPAAPLMADIERQSTLCSTEPSPVTRKSTLGSSEPSPHGRGSSAHTSGRTSSAALMSSALTSSDTESLPRVTK